MLQLSKGNCKLYIQRSRFVVLGKKKNTQYKMALCKLSLHFKSYQ